MTPADISSAFTNSQGYELVSHGTTLFPVGCYEDDLAADPFSWHWHDEIECVFVLHGSAVIHAASETYRLASGEALFVNSGVLHAGAAAEGGECCLRSAVFHPRFIGGSMDSIFWQKYLNPLLSDNTLGSICLRPREAWQTECIRLLEAAWKACGEEAPGYEFQVRTDLSRLIYLLCSHRPSAHIPPSEKKLRDDDRIKLMMQYIQAHCFSEITIEDIAQSASISVSECLRCFKNTIETTPIQYVRQYRIQKAAELLSSTSLKISDIAAQCGFQEMSYFARTFRQFRGCTPSEFRRQQTA